MTVTPWGGELCQTLRSAAGDAVGLTAGEVDVSVDGTGIRIEPTTASGFVERDGRLVIEAEVALTDDDVRRLRFADQR